jgi:hypothetical protein
MQKRKMINYLVYPKFQFTLVVANILILTLILVLIYFSANDAFNQLVEIGQKINFSTNHPYFEFVEKSRTMMNLKLRWAFGIAIFLTAVSSIFISHKMVGPIKKLKDHLFAFSQNRSTGDLKFRKGDFFNDLPEIVNKSLEKAKKQD